MAKLFTKISDLDFVEPRAINRASLNHTPSREPMRNSTWKSVPRFDEVENHRFTYRYEQPEFYRFCQDSVIFPWVVAQAIKHDFQQTPEKVLDVCAGCGVIGFELSAYLPEIKSIDFLEVQQNFQSTFERNREIAGRDSSFRFLNINYEELLKIEHADSYDLIVGNPPYFQTPEGKLSQNQEQNRCRFFIDSDLAHLVRSITNALKIGGVAYLLVKTGDQHGRSVLGQLMLSCGDSIDISAHALVRETGVVRLQKLR
jgi:tRNA1Val (adenine37-N6)-methyltransferase